MLRNIIFTLFLFVSFANKLVAGSLTAELDRTRTTPDEPAYLTITVSGSLQGDIELPPIDGLEVRSVGSSTNVQIVNGSFSKETSYNFALIPQKAGTFLIPALKFKVDKEEQSTPPLTLTVTSSGGNQQGTSQAPGASQGGSKEEQNEPGPSSDGPIVIERELAASDLYDGQAVVSTIRLYQRVNLQSATPARQPSPAWRVIPTEGEHTYQTNWHGSQVRVTEIREVLIPLKSGELTLPSFGLDVSYIQARRGRTRAGSVFDMFQNFNMGERVSKKIMTEAKKITVKPLPSAGRPAAVSDIVGAFSVKADVSKRDLAVGDTATVTVTISGNGALDRMRDLKLDYGSAARIYADKPETEEKVVDDGLSSKRVYKFAVVPRVAGSLKLGDIDLGVFNPTKKSWQSLKADLGAIQVGGGAGPTSAPPAAAPAPAAPAAEPATPQASNTQSLAAKSVDDASGSNKNNANLALWSSLGLLLIVMVAFGARFALRIFGEKKLQGPSTEQLKSVAANMSAADTASVDTAVRTLKEILADSSHAASAMTSEDVTKSARSKGWNVDIIERLRVALTAIEGATYRDAGVTEADVAQLRLVLEDVAKGALK